MRTKYNINKLLLLIFIIFLLTQYGCGKPYLQKTVPSETYFSDPEVTFFQTPDNYYTATGNIKISPPSQTPAEDRQEHNSGTLEMHVIDVGQADCILIKLPNNKVMLVDAGNNEDAEVIKNYLNNNDIKIIDYFINTHPHEDHIGSSDVIIDNYDIREIYAPRASTTTRTYENFLNAVIRKNLKIKSPQPGSYIINDKDLKIQILAPVSSNYEDLNNYSIVTKITYKNISILLTGDAEAISESDILSEGYNINAQILKVAHHGSSGATTDSFLKKVQPKYAVISVGKNNPYSHPHNDTLKRLQNIGAGIYRTDISGTIIFSTDGSKITVNKPTANSPAVTQGPDGHQSSETYIGNINTKKFHRTSCRSLPDPKNRIIFNSREQAVKEGYDPCGICKP